MSNATMDSDARTLPKALESVNIKLEWRDGGIFNTFYPKKRIDLDLGIISLSQDNRIVELISYNNLTSKDKSITHYGDNIHSTNKVNREIINIDLTKVSAEVNTLMIAVHSFNEVKIAEAHNAIIDISGDNSNKSAVFYLKDFENSTGIIIGFLTRTQDDHKWKFVAVGANAAGQSINQLASTAIMYAPKNS